MFFLTECSCLAVNGLPVENRILKYVNLESRLCSCIVVVIQSCNTNFTLQISIIQYSSHDAKVVHMVCMILLDGN